MSTSYRPAMRLLSLRLRQLNRLPPRALTQARNASRYSQPSGRVAIATPTAPASFTNVIESEGSTHNSNGLVGQRTLYEQEEDRKAQIAQAKRQSKYLGLGLVLSLVGTAYVCYQIDQTVKGKQMSLDAPHDANSTFQGKEVHVIGVGDGKRIVAEDQSGAVELVETGTSSVPHFPKTIYLPTATESKSTPDPLAIPPIEANPGNKANLEEYTLIGLGIRSVSFLSIQVYVVGMYVRTTDITGLQARLIHHVNPTASTLIPSEKEQLAKQLVDGEASREIWDKLLEIPGGAKTAWRVVPTRNTDFMHLRDGWITGINKRTAEAKKRNGNVPSEYDREDFGQSIRSFMSIFQGGKAPKGSIMVLSRDAEGGLSIFFTPKPDAGAEEKGAQLLGTIGDERISKLIWMNYLAGDKVSSEAARKGVADGCVAMASRPVGSAETMIA